MTDSRLQGSRMEVEVGSTHGLQVGKYTRLVDDPKRLYRITALTDTKVTLHEVNLWNWRKSIFLALLGFAVGWLLGWVLPRFF
jgi:hypothetical protein